MKETVIIVSLLAFLLVCQSFASEYTLGTNVSPIKPLKIDEAFTILAKANPGVGNATVIFNDSQIRVTITPGRYATPKDLVMAASSIARGYAGFLETSPFYIGYLSVGVNECNKITFVWEISAFKARAAIANGGYDELFRQFLSNGKVISKCNISPPAPTPHEEL